MSILPILINRLNAIPSKSPANIFVDIHMITLKFIGKGKETVIPKIIFFLISKLEESVYQISKTYHLATQAGQCGGGGRVGT